MTCHSQRLKRHLPIGWSGELGTDQRIDSPPTWQPPMQLGAFGETHISNVLGRILSIFSPRYPGFHSEDRDASQEPKSHLQGPQPTIISPSALSPAVFLSIKYPACIHNFSSKSSHLPAQSTTPIVLKSPLLTGPIARRPINGKNVDICSSLTNGGAINQFRPHCATLIRKKGKKGKEREEGGRSQYCSARDLLAGICEVCVE